MSLKRICGVDLGSDTIKICDKNQKKLLCEKNMIAVRNRTDLIGVGQDAFEIGYQTVNNLIDTLEGEMIEGEGKTNIIEGIPLQRGDTEGLDTFLEDLKTKM